MCCTCHVEYIDLRVLYLSCRVHRLACVVLVMSSLRDVLQLVSMLCGHLTLVTPQFLMLIQARTSKHSCIDEGRTTLSAFNDCGNSTADMATVSHVDIL